MPDEFAVSGTFKIDVNHLVGRELTSAMVTVRADTVAEWREIIREAIRTIMEKRTSARPTVPLT